MTEPQHRSIGKHQPRAARTDAAPTPEPTAAVALPGLAVRRKTPGAAIEAGLGRLNIPGVAAHMGSGAAGALGARAFATGEHIALGDGVGALPHEAAHVVQQRAGRARPTLEAAIPSVLEQDAGAISGHPSPRADVQR